MSTETERYYGKRAQEYDRVYAKPERADDIAGLSSLIVDALAGRRVLELAAGTGFWTKDYADHAAAVTATDLNPSTLAVARARRKAPVDDLWASTPSPRAVAGSTAQPSNSLRWAEGAPPRPS